MLVQPTHQEVLRFGGMAGVIGSAAAQGRRRVSGFDPLDLTSAVHDWDMEGTITAATDVTQVNDLIGTDHITVISGNAPLLVASDSDLGSRKAAQHDGANSEALEDAAISSVSQPFTTWLIFTHDSLSGTQEVFGGSDFGVIFYDDATDRWEMDNNTDFRQIDTTLPAVDTAYLMIVVWDATNEMVHINGVSQSLSGTTAGATALTDFGIGVTFPVTNFGNISWTRGGVVDAAMSSGDRASLLAWAQANAGVA